MKIPEMIGNKLYSEWLQQSNPELEMSTTPYPDVVHVKAFGRLDSNESVDEVGFVMMCTNNGTLIDYKNRTGGMIATPMSILTDAVLVKSIKIPTNWERFGGKQ